MFCHTVLAVYLYLYAAREDVYIKMHSRAQAAIISLEVRLTNGIVGSEICTYTTARRHSRAWKYESFSTALRHTQATAVIVFTVFASFWDEL